MVITENYTKKQYFIFDTTKEIYAPKKMSKIITEAKIQNIIPLEHRDLKIIWR